MIELQDIAGVWMKVFEPPPRMTVSEWADRFRFLSPESSSNPGKYSSAMTPYAVEWMDSANADNVTGIVLMVASQLGKTEALNNITGYFMDIEPAPILLVQPTIDLAESWSKERLGPMVRDTPALFGKVADVRSRYSGNTILHKTFPGGNIAIAGANAPSGLASRPRRVVQLDEVDRFPPSAGTEGDPCAIAIRRTESYWNPVVILTSSPTVKFRSRIEAEWNLSDQRRWYCPCPKCEHRQTLKWSQVRHEAEDGSDAWYQCESCAARLTDDERRTMVRRGDWRAEFPHRKLRGYHLNGIASLFRHKRGYVSRLHQMVADHLKAKAGGKTTLQTWVNTFLAETWEEEGEGVAWEPLLQRRENWGDFPEKGLVITAGVDVQGDRVEIEFVAHGEGEETWSLDHVVIIGDFNRPEVQADVDEKLQRKWSHPSGVELCVACTCIDSGHKTKAVYAFAKRRAMRRVYAVKGQGGVAIPLVSRPTRRGVEKALLFSVGTDTAKELIYSRLTLSDVGAGYLHFPSDRAEDWFRQLTSEVRVTRYKDGVPYAKFENPSKARNEALDCRVYATAALALLQPNWKKLAVALAPREEKPDAPAPVEKRNYRLRGGGLGYVNNW
ncbi:MAG: phage terminase large subunit family protein [Verrucomicrobiota bacterium]